MPLGVLYWEEMWYKISCELVKFHAHNFAVDVAVDFYMRHPSRCPSPRSPSSDCTMAPSDDEDEMLT